MRLIDYVSRVFIDTDKLTAYALNVDHPHGKHKAYVFASALGYSRDNYQGLVNQICGTVLFLDATLVKNNAYGQHLRVDIEITGPLSKTAIVRTGWLIEPDSDTAVLTTLFVL